MINYVYHVNVLGNIIKGNAWAVPNPSQGWCQIFEGKIPTQFFLGVPIGFYSQTISVSGTLPYDNAPGGKLDVNKQIADGDTDYGDITTNYPNHCFIPTISSLDIQTTDLFYNVSAIPNYPYPNNISITPFDAIYAPISNQDHVTVTTENIVWLVNEASPNDLYLQNRTITEATDFEAKNTVTTGRNVTNQYPQGDFIVENTGHVSIRGGESVTLKPGTHLKPKPGGSIRIYIDDFFDCTINTIKMADADGNDFPPAVEEYKTMFKEDTVQFPEKTYLIRNYPNPFSDETTIEYKIKKSNTVTITIFNSFGNELFVLKNKLPHEAGIYQIHFNGINLPSGIYYYSLQTNDYMETKKMIKIE